MEGPDNVTFGRADAQIYPLAGQVFDVVISQFAAMFFADPVAACANIGSSMRPGGRLTLLTWQELRDNEWLTAIRAALAAGRSLPEPPAGAPGPFGLADPDVVLATLTGAGFSDVTLEPVREPLHLGADAAEAFSFVS